MEATAAEKKSDSANLFDKALSEAADFGQGIFHGAVENPVNGIVQLANHVSGAHLPELHVVDEQKISKSAGGMAGTVAGTVLDIAALTFVTGGLGDLVAGGAGAAGAGAVAAGAAEAGAVAAGAETAAVGTGVVAAGAETAIAGTGAAAGGANLLATAGSLALRLGAVGAVYSGVLQPTDANSKTFVQDRLTNGAVGFATFAAMGAAAPLLDSTGIFATSAVRSLGGSITYGGIAGAVGGAAHAESTAVFKQGKALPTIGALAGDVASYGALGMAFGAASFGVNHLTPLDSQTVTADGRTATVYTDNSGTPVKAEVNGPSLNDPYQNVFYRSTKMTNGTWSTNAFEANSDGTPSILGAVAPHIDDVQVNGSQIKISGGSVVREFNDGGAYVREDASVPEWAAHPEQYWAKYYPKEDINGTTVGREYDEQMRPTGLWSARTTPPAYAVDNEASFSYGQDGALNRVMLGVDHLNEIGLEKQADGSWNFSNGSTQYRWQGDIKVQPNGGPGQPEKLVFNSPDGIHAYFYDVTKGAQGIIKLLKLESAPVVTPTASAAGAAQAASTAIAH
jgi:hypothetical protein